MGSKPHPKATICEIAAENSEAAAHALKAAAIAYKASKKPLGDAEIAKAVHLLESAKEMATRKGG